MKFCISYPYWYSYLFYEFSCLSSQSIEKKFILRVVPRYFQLIFNGDYICISPFNKYPFFPPAPPFINPLNKNPQMADTYISAGKNAVFYCDTVSVQGEKPPSPPIWKKNGKDIGANRGQ